MAVSDTEAKIVQIITDHYLGGAQERLTIQVVSERAKISRQAFHKNYLHLKPYITGEKPVDELLVRETLPAEHVIFQSQQLIRSLQETITKLRSGMQAEVEKIKQSYITTLMNRDLSIKYSDLLREELKKKALQVEILKGEKDELKNQLSLVSSGVHLNDARKQGEVIADIVLTYEADLSGAKALYAKDQDIENYLELKRVAIQSTQEKINKFLRKESMPVVIFQERYLNRFDKFVGGEFARATSPRVVACIPLFSRSEMKVFVAGLKGATTIEVYAPHNDSDIIMKAQRKFLFHDVPEFEFKTADKEPYPTVYDGFSRVTIFKVEQGD
ncbi:hypothetical protein [Pseudomonas sp. NPDC086278]|uniref:hypothetical protein n=1 Tax=Pseudomonas sp. NPDC086278 TaxID=3390646 RepID=UPI003CFCCCB7